MNYRTSRRIFLHQSTLAALGTLMEPWKLWADKKPLISFGLVTDSHYADRDPSPTRFYRESIAKMQECVKLFNKKKPDFAIHLGDFKDEDESKQSLNTISYLKALEAEFAKFKGPRYHCVGNHDVDSIRKQEFLENIENTGIAKDKSYFSFDIKGYQLFVLDANYHFDGRDHYYKEGADWQETWIPQEQLDWLEQSLETTNKPALVFCHHPLYKFENRDAVYYVSNYEKVQQVMERSGKVQAVFHGHTHKEDHQVINGIHYATFLAMVDYSGEENNAYSIVEIYDEGIEVIGYRREESKSWG